jgi:hypothetical protein
MIVSIQPLGQRWNVLTLPFSLEAMSAAAEGEEVENRKSLCKLIREIAWCGTDSEALELKGIFTSFIGIPDLTLYPGSLVSLLPSGAKSDSSGPST